MKRTLIYLVGEPGSGKSTAMAAATSHFQRHPQQAPLAHDLLVSEAAIEAVELGKRRGTFSGTDALPMNAITKAEELLRSTLAPVVLGEGARLGCRRFLEAAVSAGYKVHLIHLSTPHAEAQRQQRGAAQKDSWVKGARTRADNLANLDIPGVDVTRINGAQADVAAALKSLITKAVQEAA
ncbi:adenylate kinase [Arthrobacter phage Ottawa]|nr:adenylate kinase [Arthrobacter phage Kharcho]WIC89307.1 adenylate kinase [Arthrobacter phage Ottawa]